MHVLHHDWLVSRVIAVQNTAHLNYSYHVLDDFVLLDTYDDCSVIYLSSSLTLAHYPNTIHPILALLSSLFFYYLLKVSFASLMGWLLLDWIARRK